MIPNTSKGASGFTLVETLITLGLSTIVAFAASLLINEVTKHEINARNIESSLGFMNLVRKSLSSGDVKCKKILANTIFTGPLPADIPLKLTIAGMPVEAGVSNVFGGSAADPNRTQVNSVLLKNTHSTSVANGGQSLLGSLEINVTQFKNNSGFLKIYKIGGLMINVDSGFAIMGCSGLAESKLEEICISIGAVWNVLEQICKPKTPSCPGGSMVILDSSNTPACLDFNVYLAGLCAPGEALKTNASGNGILCTL